MFSFLLLPSAKSAAELYDTSVTFRQCEDADTCKYCDFNVICKR